MKTWKAQMSEAVAAAFAEYRTAPDIVAFVKAEVAKQEKARSEETARTLYGKKS